MILLTCTYIHISDHVHWLYTGTDINTYNNGGILIHGLNVINHAQAHTQIQIKIIILTVRKDIIKGQKRSLLHRL